MKYLKCLTPLIAVSLLLTACSTHQPNQDINEVLLSIHNYACALSVTLYSNKNTNTYVAIQEYNADGSYYMEFLDPDNFKIQFTDNTLQLSSNLFETQYFSQYEDSNQNPLFLSYFLNHYFNSEDSSIIEKTASSLTLKMPEQNENLYQAVLTIENNQPKTLTYLDKNGTPKVNIIYSEFQSNSSC